MLIGFPSIDSTVPSAKLIVSVDASITRSASRVEPIVTFDQILPVTFPN